MLILFPREQAIPQAAPLVHDLKYHLISDKIQIKNAFGEFSIFFCCADIF